MIKRSRLPKRKLFRVSMVFDMSWGARSRLIRLAHRSYSPKSFLVGVRNYGYFARGRFIPATRLVEARITEIVKP